MTERTVPDAAARHCPECGTRYPPHMSDDTLPPEVECPACHGEPEVADRIIAARNAATRGETGAVPREWTAFLEHAASCRQCSDNQRPLCARGLALHERGIAALDVASRDPSAELRERPVEDAGLRKAHREGTCMICGRRVAVDAYLHAVAALRSTPSAPPPAAVPKCGNCHRCLEGESTPRGLPVTATRMILCPDCGNKRCPKASDCRLACTGSNASGQPGSVYGGPPAAVPVSDAREHELKVWPSFFDDLLSGDKTFEVRKDDRGFRVGDVLHLREYVSQGHGDNYYTGRELYRRVTYILAGRPWLTDGYVIMGLATLQSSAAPDEQETE